MVYEHQRKEESKMSYTPDRVLGMPNVPKTPVRGIRVEDGLWRAAQAKAAAEGRTLTAVLVAYLKRYISTPPRKKAEGAEGAVADE
jgi:hypothetical protein